MNGVRFLARVKERVPHAQRIMLTGQADQQAIEEAINRSEIFRFISKPWNDRRCCSRCRARSSSSRSRRRTQRLAGLTRAQNEELRALERRAGGAGRAAHPAAGRRQARVGADLRLHRHAAGGGARGGPTASRRANIAYARVAGRPVQRSSSQNPRCHQFLFGRDTPCTGCPMKTAIATRQGRPGGDRCTGTDLRRWTCYPMAEEGQAVCAYRDVTEERKMHPRAWSRPRRWPRWASSPAAWRTRSTTRSAGILAFAQLMKRDEGRSREDLESLELIEESALRCKRIVESLLQVQPPPQDG